MLCIVKYGGAGTGGLREAGIIPTPQSASPFMHIAQHPPMCPAAFPVQNNSPLFVGGMIVNDQRPVVREKRRQGHRGKDRPSVTGQRKQRKARR